MTEHEKDCKEMIALLSAYIDEDLPVETCEELSEHIAGCAPCVEFMESLKKSVELCRKYSAEERPGPLPEEARHELRAAWERMMEDRARKRESGA